MCRSMVDIQSPTAEIRRGKKRKKKIERNYRMKILWSALLHRATIKISVVKVRITKFIVVITAMSHLRFCRATLTRDFDARLWRATLTRDSDARQSRSVRLYSRTLRLWRRVHEKHKLNERGQKRKTWERDWVAKRRQYGTYHGLVREIRDSDPAAYRNFMRMDDEISLHHSVQY